MKSWRSAWRSLRKAAGLDSVRFHDGRHTALTRLAEAGQPDWVIQAQLGHVSPAMMKTYSHIRRKALDGAAAALEPVLVSEDKIGDSACDVEPGDDVPVAVTSQVASQSWSAEDSGCEIVQENGSSGWIRTSNPPVNRTMPEMLWVSVECVLGRFSYRHPSWPSVRFIPDTYAVSHCVSPAGAAARPKFAAPA
jgi:hypothetical protein